MRGLVTPMRPLLLATCVALAVATPARASSLLFDYLGFDYESPNPNAATFGELGSGYVGLGTVPFLFAPLVSNTAVNEYTFVIDGLTSTSITPIGTSNVIAYSTGTLTIYEDPTAGGTTATFAPNPPNPTVPSSFTDGTPILVGSLTNFQFVVDTATGTGYFEAVLTVTGGTQLGNFPLDQRTGWTFSGSTSNALNIPPGYAHQLDGQAFLNSATATRHTSWGQLKAGYR
jgi:hypothetical protein